MIARTEGFASARDARFSAQRCRFAATLLLAVALVSAGCDSSPEARERYVREKRAFAELLVRRAPSHLISAPAKLREDEFELYRAMQAKLIKDPFVLNAVLRDPQVAELEILQGKEDASGFLEEKLEVDVVAHEFLRISFAGPPSKEAAALVNAVTEVYLQEAANAEAVMRSTRARDLEKAHQDLDDLWKTKTRAYKRFLKDAQPAGGGSDRQTITAEAAARIGAGLIEAKIDLLRDRARLEALEKTGHGPSAEKAAEALLAAGGDEGFAGDFERDPVLASHVARKAVLLEILAQPGSNSEDQDAAAPFKRELAAVEKSLTARRDELRARIVAKHPPPESPPGGTLAELPAAIAANERLISLLEQELAKSHEALQAGSWSFEIEQLRREMDQVTELSRQIAEEMMRLRIEGDAAPRVSLFRKAEAHD